MGETTEATEDTVGDDRVALLDKETKPRPKGLPDDEEWDLVEFSEQQQRRFNRVYRENKERGEQLHQMFKDQRALFDKIDGLEKRTIEAEKSSRIDELKDLKKRALEESDFSSVVEVDDQIASIRAQPVEEKNPEPKPQQQETNADPVVMEAVNTWALEKNEDGSFKRPWAADEGHPLHLKAASMAHAAMSDPTIPTTADALDEVDRLMNVTKVARNRSTVLSSDSNISTKRKKQKLTEAQKAVAVKMGLSEEKYLRGLENA